MLKRKLKYFMAIWLVLFLCGFTGLTEQVAPPKDIPKRTEDVNAGIVIPSWDCTSHNVIKWGLAHKIVFISYINR